MSVTALPDVDWSWHRIVSTNQHPTDIGREGGMEVREGVDCNSSPGRRRGNRL